jgi:uncharacterized protein
MYRSAKDSLLWSVTTSLGQTSWLFGTMHVRSSVAHQFLDGIMPYLIRSEMLAAEMDLDEVDQELMLRSTILPEGSSLKSLLGERQFAKSRKSILKSFGVDLLPFQYRHPFLVIASISESLLVNDQLDSLDQEIWNRAKSLNKVCAGLESFGEQMAIMEQIPIRDSVRQIRDIGRNPGRYRRNLHKMIDFYVEQDVRQLYKSSRKQLQGLRKTLLFDRNRKMAARLDELMQTATVFAAVGAAHLGGEKGMLRLLRQKGFEVKPIRIGSESGDYEE